MRERVLNAKIVRVIIISVAVFLSLGVLGRLVMTPKETVDFVAEVIPEGLNHFISNSESNLSETIRMERMITNFMSQWEIVGASLAIMKDGKLVYSKGFGKADQERNEDMDVRHIFRIASLSKLITATAIMKLYEQGRISLDATIFGENGILNDSIFLDIKDKRISKITVEHLLRHQGGFSLRAGDPLFSPQMVARQMSVELPIDITTMVRYASQTRLRYVPGESNIYSNLGYVVLTKVIEKVTGERYEDYVKSNILHPIGCYDMHIGHTPYEERFQNEVRYYEPSDAEPVEAYDGSELMVPKRYGSCDMQVLSGAGGWVASPTELMRFVMAIDPQYKHTTPILKPSTVAYMTEMEKGRYPIGWMKTTKNEDWVRTGSLAGASAMLKRQNNGYTWVFLTNTSSWSGSRFPSKIDVMIRQALAKVTDWPDRDLFQFAETSQSVAPNLTSQSNSKISRP